jgi:hypothetical protein
MTEVATREATTLAETLWASAVVAAVVSGVVSLVTAWMSARFQTNREESAWQRTARLDVYVQSLNGFERAVSAAMKLGLELFVWKIAQAATQQGDTEEPAHIDELGAKLVEAETAFAEARTRAVVVGSPEIVIILRKMSSLVFEVGSEARQGSDTGSDKWHQWREQGNKLRLAFANEARRSLGFTDLKDWPSFADVGVQLNESVSDS